MTTVLMACTVLAGTAIPAQAEYIQSGGYRWAGLAQQSDCLRYKVYYSDDGKFLREETSVVSWSYCMGGGGGGTTTPTQMTILQFDANGGKNAPAAQKFPDAVIGGSTVNVTIPTQKPTFDGHQFLGWADTKDATKAQYQGGQTVQVQKSTTRTLYAVWDQPDTTPPVINGTDDKTIQAGENFDPKQGVTATDDVDGDLTPAITITGTVDVNTPSNYKLTYTVSDKAGNKTTATRTITVTQTSATIACAPQTGDPAASIWQASTMFSAFVCIGLAMIAMRMRWKTRLQV